MADKAIEWNTPEQLQAERQRYETERMKDAIQHQRLMATVIMQLGMVSLLIEILIAAVVLGFLHYLNYITLGIGVALLLIEKWRIRRACKEEVQEIENMRNGV